MKLCFIGKYPPIEGGVSSTNYWLARGMAERGHEINLVTNADEVEPAFRMLLEPDDWPFYQPEFPQSGGRVRVFNTEPFTLRAMDHIPASNPFVSKLASLATGVVRNLGCEAIYAYYYEPYAVAAALVAHWTGRPLIVKHAGSDLDRLCRVPDLATAYKEVLRSADAVVTQPPLMGRFLGMGVREEALCADVPFPVPGHLFRPSVEPLNIDRLAIRSLRDPASRDTIAPPRFDAGVPTIGIYGKIGVAKGTFDLIAALGQLASDGANFNLAAMIGAEQAERLIPSLKAAGLLERTYALPFLPNWKVPAFIRACTAVCFLERDFPVAIHGPMVPREVLACGTCLILSREIADKQTNSAEFASGENLILVDDPKNHVQLAEKLRAVLANPETAAAIGIRGALIEPAREDHSQFINGWEQIFQRVTQMARGVSTSSGHVNSDDSSRHLLRRFAPRVRAEIERTQPDLVREFLETSAERDSVAAGLQFCAFLVRHLQGDGFSAETRRLLDVVRYQGARLRAAFDQDDDGPVFAVVDRLNSARVSEQAAGQLAPVRSGSAEILSFDYDVTPYFADGTGLIEIAEPGLQSLRKEQMYVLFQRTANLVPKELRINEATRELIRRCDGSQTVSDVITALCTDSGVDSPERRMKIVDALDALHRANIVVFGERKPGWGWTSGVRWTAAEVPE